MGRACSNVAHMVKMRNAYRSLVRKSEGKRPQEKTRHRWEDNIKMNLMERGCEDVNWIYMHQYRVLRWVHVNKLRSFGFHKRQEIY
jgi:hypothetical protein